MLDKRQKKWEAKGPPEHELLEGTCNLLPDFSDYPHAKASQSEKSHSTGFWNGASTG